MARTGAVLSTTDCILRDCFEDAIQQELSGYTHKCGHTYAVKLLDHDGRVMRWSPTHDSHEGCITATCSNPRCTYRSTQQSYSRFSISSHAFSAMSAKTLVEVLSMELRRAVDCLALHLRTLHVTLDMETKAEVAEVTTRLLAARGTALLSEVARLFEIEDDATQSDLGDFLHALGFVRNGNWRVPVPKAHIGAVTEAQTITAMPTFSFETREDVLLALPADHPLAA